jgi:hypothetical protein
VQRFVLTTAAEALAPAKYGSPPLKPFQAGSGGHHQQVVWSVDLSVSLQARTYHERRDEARDAG